MAKKKTVAAPGYGLVDSSLLTGPSNSEQRAYAVLKLDPQATGLVEFMRVLRADADAIMSDPSLTSVGHDVRLQALGEAAMKQLLTMSLSRSNLFAADIRRVRSGIVSSIRPDADETSPQAEMRHREIRAALSSDVLEVRAALAGVIERFDPGDAGEVARIRETFIAIARSPIMILDSLRADGEIQKLQSSFLSKLDPSAHAEADLVESVWLLFLGNVAVAVRFIGDSTGFVTKDLEPIGDVVRKRLEKNVMDGGTEAKGSSVEPLLSPELVEAMRK